MKKSGVKMNIKLGASSKRMKHETIKWSSKEADQQGEKKMEKVQKV